MLARHAAPQEVRAVLLAGDQPEQATSVLTRNDLRGAHKRCFHGWNEQAIHKFFGPNNTTGPWQVKSINRQSMAT